MSLPTAEDLKVLSAFNLDAIDALIESGKRSRQKLNLLEDFKKTRLALDRVADGSTEQLTLLLRLKSGIQQIKIQYNGDPDAEAGTLNAKSFQDLDEAVDAIYAKLETPGTPEKTAADKVLALPDLADTNQGSSA